MSDLPPIAVCLLTYERTKYARRTIGTFVANVQYPGEIVWVLADDGSGEGHRSEISDLMRKLEQKISGGSFSKRLGPGPAWTRAAKAALEISDFVFWLEDDWEARSAFSLEPYVRLLQQREDVGMVRLGHMAVGLLLESVGYNGIHYLNVTKDRQYCYSGNPSLRHRRHFDAYGYYPDDPEINPGDCEIFHDQLVRAQPGPQIWWPIDVGGWGLFGHIGEEQSY